MADPDTGLLWAVSAESSFEESRRSLSLFTSNFEEDANTRPGESTESPPRQEPVQSATPSGLGDETKTSLILSFSPVTLCYSACLV